jgi:uncharacterized protein YndB with AHSA1/START domain
MTLLLALALAAASPAPLPPPAVRTMVEADGSHTLVHEILVEAPPGAVWQAISTPEGWMSWAVPVARIAGPDLIETSYDKASEPGGPATIRQSFVARIPGRMLAFRTVKAPSGFTDAEAFAEVVNVFELVPHGERQTLVRLTGSNYPAGPAGARLLAMFTRGNSISLENLRRRFAEGPIDWEKRERR